MAKFAEKMQIELQKVSAKFEESIEAYEKKGVNPLTKKLIEKKKTEMAQAIQKRE